MDFKKPYNNIPPGPKPPKVVYCFVEIPKGGTNKYEFDKKMGVFTLDRVLYGSVFYPTEYGHVPGTLAEDGDALDIMVVATFSTFPGCLIKAKPIGAIEIIDSGEKDTKIIAVACDDPRVNSIKTVTDISPHFKSEIEDFWLNYAKLQPQKKVVLKGWRKKKTAHKIINQSIEKFRCKK